MKHFLSLPAAAVLCFGLALGPVQAQDENSDIDEGVNLVEEGMKLFFKGLTQELEPALEDFAKEIEPALRGLVEEMGPAMAELVELIGEIEQYHPPEKLPNGDIILRRKSPVAPDIAAPEGQTDL